MDIDLDGQSRVYCLNTDQGFSGIERAYNYCVQRYFLCYEHGELSQMQKWYNSIHKVNKHTPAKVAVIVFFPWNEPWENLMPAHGPLCSGVFSWLESHITSLTPLIMSSTTLISLIMLSICFKCLWPFQVISIYVSLYLNKYYGFTNDRIFSALSAFC